MDRKIVEHLVLGGKINRIARTLHVGKTRVRRLRGKAKEYGYLGENGIKGDVALPPYPEAIFPDPVDKRSLKISESHRLLDGYREWIEERLKAGWHAVTVFEELPVDASRSSYYRYLEKHRLSDLGRKVRRVVPEIVHKPGEALILDWGKLRDVIDPLTGRKKTLWTFTGVLGFSRYTMVRLVWSNDTETTLKAIEGMLLELGGVPYKITTDNPKCFAIKASKYEPILNPAFERFAGHYGITIECLPPSAPEKKGKVERPMPYIRRLYEAHGDRWDGISESQEYIDKKLKIANERKHGTTQMRPIDLFITKEIDNLKKLPCLSYEIEQTHDGTVRQDGHIRFGNKYYSVDEKYIGSKVTVLGNSERVSIYCGGKLIETHARLKDPYRSKSTKSEHLKPWERSLEDNSVYRRRAKDLGYNVEKLIVEILQQGQGFIDTRKVWGILSLDKSYSKERINEACRAALEMRSFSYRTVKNLLHITDKKQDKAWKVPNDKKVVKLDSYKFLRSLSEYKEQLTLNYQEK